MCVPCVARMLQHNKQVEEKQRYLNINKTGEDANMCPMCGKNFVNKTGEEANLCPMCGKNFATQQAG